MQYRSFPKSQVKLSVLGYGCMRFPIAISGKIDRQVATKQLKLAIDNGVNYIDTAYPYHFGDSEKFIGEFLSKTGYRDKVFIATKLPCFLITKPDVFETFFDKQISKLQTEYVDFYLLHALTGSLYHKMKDFGVLDFLTKLKKSGKAKHIGFSFHGTHDDFKMIVDDYDWDFTQVQYNLLDVHFQAGEKGIEYAAKKGMGVIIMEPLRGGTLVSKVPHSVQKVWDIAPIKRSPADWALRWILNNENIHVVLSGMNDENHIMQNIQTVSDSYANGLTKDELDIIARAKAAFERLLKIKCTGCGYCMPCPAKIDIPAAFHSVNNLFFTKRPMEIFGYVSVVGLSEKHNWTSACMDCGKCEKACPQRLEIRNEFKKVRRYLERPLFKAFTHIILKPLWSMSEKKKRENKKLNKKLD